METTPLEAQILEIILEAPGEEVNVYSLFKKGIPRSSAHSGLLKLEERELVQSRWVQGEGNKKDKKAYFPTPRGRIVGSRLHVPRGDEVSFPTRWQKWYEGRFGAAFSNVGGGVARGFITSNSGPTKEFTLPVMASMVTSNTTETFQFQAISGRPVVRYDPLCRNCGGKLSSEGELRYCSRCDSPLQASRPS